VKAISFNPDISPTPSRRCGASCAASVRVRGQGPACGRPQAT